MLTQNIIQKCQDRYLVHIDNRDICSSDSTGTGVNKKGGRIMRKLISLLQLIEDLEDEGHDISQVFIAQEDLIEAPETSEEE